MNSSWERPKGQSGSGETQLNRPRYCPARPCCTVSPLLILFLPIKLQAKGGAHIFPSLASCRWFALPFHSLIVTTEMRNSSYSSAWVHCQNSAYLPATWESPKVSLPEGKKATNGIAISKTHLSLFSKWPKPPHKSADWGTVVGHYQESPKGHPKSLRSNSCKPGQFSVREPASLQLCC